MTSFNIGEIRTVAIIVDSSLTDIKRRKDKRDINVINNITEISKKLHNFYKKLDEVYHFDFDPCPYQSDFDGLKMEWGKSNFVNPPYSRKLKEAFVHKALEQKAKGKRSVLLLPVSTSTKLFHEVILPNAEKIEFVKGRLKFEQKDENGNFYSKGCGQHDSMIVIF